MMPLNHPRSRSYSPGRNNALSMDRQKLIWILSVSIVFGIFLSWNNKIGIEEFADHTATVNKAFQVNGKHEMNHTGVIKQISLIGERNSGTKWMWGHLLDCFNHSIPVEKKFTRYKHWFMPRDYFRYPHDTLVIAEFRNPYDWLRAMREVPHHSPAHANLPWKKFLSKPWTMPRIGLDLELKGTEMCQHHFKYKDLISCIHRPVPNATIDERHSLDRPFYEMRNDGSGLPYDNIMELRSDKIRNILEIKDFPGVADLWMVQYEYMVSHGTQQILDRIEEWTGVKPKCDAYPPQFRRQRNMTKDFVQYVTDHLNWTVEELIGYEPTVFVDEGEMEDNDDS